MGKKVSVCLYVIGKYQGKVLSVISANGKFYKLITDEDNKILSIKWLDYVLDRWNYEPKMYTRLTRVFDEEDIKILKEKLGNNIKNNVIIFTK